MDTKVIAFYRDVFEDLTVDRGEASELTSFLVSLNPPPDKLVWLRATAFKIASEFLSSSEQSNNVNLLRTVNFVVHAIEQVCMEPKSSDKSVPFNEETLTDFYSSIFQDLSIDQEENEQVRSFFNENAPQPEDLVETRALIFKVACNHLSSEGDVDTNTQLLRCINAVVHAFEMECYKPKAFKLQVEPSADLSNMSLSEAVQHLWELDANRLHPGSDYVLNVQGGKKPYLKEDLAADPLFTSIDKSVWKRPTYATFRSLLDNYSAETGNEEVVTNTERTEVTNFLKAILQTAPMQFCMQYCHARAPDMVTGDLSDFKSLLHQIWFELYKRSRGGRLDSSGFEHVFVGEVKNGEVSGFHNWIHMALEEQAGHFDYRGYIKPKSQSSSDSDSNDHLLTIQFKWRGVEKFVGTSFIGVSPEFEMALYTMCFLVGEEENQVELNTGTDTFGLTIKCYKMAGNKIGTSFPEVTEHYD